MNRFVNSSRTTAILIACLLPLIGRATTAPFLASASVKGTNLVTFAQPDEALLNSISDGFLIITFSSPMRASTVGDNWSSWGSPPTTESSTPRVLWSGQDTNFNPITAVTFSFSQPVSIFGFEAEPGPTNVRTLTANYFMAGQLVKSVSLAVNGNAGAQVFTAIAPPGAFFDSVTLASDADWAVGQIRYSVLPDLTIAKTHPGGSAGHFSQGQNGATYTLSVGNIGQAPSTGLVTVAETLPPSGLTLVSMAGTGWTCGPPNPSNICSRTDAVAVHSAFPVITVTVNVSPTAPATLTNTATVSGGGELNTDNDTALDPTTMNPITNVSGQVSVTQTGFGRNRATGLWVATMTVTNTTASPLIGPLQVVLTNLTPSVTMTNNTGLRNGSSYITAAAANLAPGASVNVAIQFLNPSNGLIGFTPITQSGIF